MVVANPARSLYPEERRVYPVYPVYAACPVYPVYPELRREPRREPRTEPRSERTRKALRALCVSALSSIDVCPFNFELLALFTLSPEASHEGSVVEGSTARPVYPEERREHRRRVDRTLPSLSPNSHRITSFAHPHPITPIESYSCKKQGGGVPLTPSRERQASCLCATRRNPRNSNPYMGLLHNSPTPPGGRYIRHSSLRNLSALCVSALSLLLIGFRLSTPRPVYPEPRRERSRRVDCSATAEATGQSSELSSTPRRLHNAHSPKMLK
jgi:hypothetical protein